jgi:two-component sensor histidine kinase
MIFSSVQSRTDRLTSMIRKAGVNAYACFPLMAGQRLLGTISFGSRKRSSFDDDEIELLRTIAHHVALAQDRWRSEQVLAKALAEKEVLIRQQEILLREVNHRIKNNLQLVSSLLNMQGVNCGDSVAEEHLAKAARRVTAIAVVHDRLYQGADLENVDMADYIGDLCTQIATSTGADGRLKLKAELINLSADRAVPMAIILNELVTNALKHAYAPGQAGQVQVVLARSDTGIELVVEDAGRGMHPSGGEKPSKGLGMRVVTMLARQLNAQLSIEDAAPGTRFRLSLAS